MKMVRITVKDVIKNSIVPCTNSTQALDGQVFGKKSMVRLAQEKIENFL